MIEFLEQWGPALWNGTQLTLFISFASYVLALLLGLVLALARLDRRRWYLYWPAQIFIEIIRGTPLLLQLFYLFFVLPFFGIQLSPLVAGILGMAINYGAYMSEIYRAGIEAVDRGQWEAANALALPWTKIMRFVVLPQAIRIIIPPMGNYLVSLFKDTALVSTISITELMYTSRLIGAQTFQYVMTFTIAMAIYFVISYPAARGVEWLERRMRID